MDELKDTDVAPASDAPASPASEASDPAGTVATPVERDKPALDEWGKVRQLARKQLDRFMSFEPKVLRGDDPDAIHDMRVASRRLQQVLDLLYPPPPPREVRRLRRKIRRCRRALSEVRNCDVLLQRVEGYLTRKQTARREIWTAVEHYLHQRRSENFDKALRKLSKVNLAVFYVHLKEFLTSDGAGPDRGQRAHPLASAEELVADLFYQRIAQGLERVWQAFETQIGHSHQDPRAPVIHGVRIAAKRLRYLIEVIREFEVPGSADMLAWLRGLQQHLGDWHDLEVLEQMMIEMVARPEFLRDHLDIAMGVEKLILRNRTTKKGYQDKYFRMTLESAEFQRMKDWVAYLLSSPSAAFATA